MSTQEFSRRSFLKGTGAGFALAAGSMAGIATAHAKEPKWTKTADVVVVGYGGAGAATAITAADNGASVIVLERQPQKTLRSNTRMSGGIFHCPDKSGNKDALKAYAKAMFSGENIPGKLEGEQPEVSDGLAQAWADYTPGLLDWMKSLDPKFQAFATPGFKGAAFPKFPGAKDCGYQVYRSFVSGPYSARIQQSLLWRPQGTGHLRRSFLAVPGQWGADACR